MNKLAILFPAALVAMAATAQTAPPVVSNPPKLFVIVINRGVMWFTQNAYSVSISPGKNGELPTQGLMVLPPGTYCFTAVGARNRTACQSVTVE